MIQVMLYIKEGDPEIHRIKRILSGMQNDFPHELNVIIIDRAQVLVDEYRQKVPVLDIGVFRLIKSFDEEEIHFAFSRAEKRLEEAQQKGNDVLVKRISEPVHITKSDRLSRLFSNHYMVLLNLFTFLYVFIAVLAPTFMQIGWQVPARVIYKVYSPLCHQLAFRSFFIFGAQAYYPRTLAGVEDMITYGDATGFDENDLTTARNFVGNEVMGYKIALCQRDIAIYGTILGFGILFSLTGKRINPLPWLLWILIGLAPIGIDGFSQLLSQTNLSILNWLPLRESTPTLRIITGALFGLATAWFGFPYLEESVQENRLALEMKFAIVNQIH
jgi:uncharacterized membrane protein